MFSINIENNIQNRPLYKSLCVSFNKAFVSELKNIVNRYLENLRGETTKIYVQPKYCIINFEEKF